MKKPLITVRGIHGAIPAGYVVGRTDPGTGAIHLIPLASLAQKLGGSGGGLVTQTQLQTTTHTINTLINSISQGLDGLDGDEGPAGPPGPPGPAGADGISTTPGPQGPIGYGINGEDGDEGLPIPGPAGPQGIQGIQGPAGSGGGSVTVGPPGLDGEDGEAGFPIPGPAGPLYNPLPRTITPFSTNTAVTFNSGYWGGTCKFLPAGSLITGLAFYATAAAATAQITVGFYSVSGGAPTTLVAHSSTITGVVVGLNEFPLTAPYLVSIDTLLYVGFLTTVVSISVGAAAAAAVAYFGSGSQTAPLPTTAGSPTYGASTWGSMWLY